MTELMKATEQAQGGGDAGTVVDYVTRQLPAIESQLAGAMNSSAFVRAALTSIRGDANLQQASGASVVGAIMLAAQLKLEIGSALGHFYLTPRKNDGKWECLPIIGYRGYIELAYRSGRIDSIGTELVRKGDRWERGADSERGRWFEWVPDGDDESRPWDRVVAIATIHGQPRTVWASLTPSQVNARRPKSSGGYSPWQSHPEAMARKTAIRELASYLPMSTDLGRALEADEQKVEQVQGVSELVVTRTDQEP